MTEPNTDIVIQEDQMPDALFQFVSLELLDRLRDYKTRLLAMEEDLKEKILAMGQMLIEVNTILPKQEMFKGWIEKGLGWSTATAYNYMAVYKKFGTLGDLKALAIPQSGLYMLASDNVSEEIRREIIERAQNGEKFDTRSIKNAIQLGKQARERATKADKTDALDPTECLWCGKKNILVYPMRNTRRGICAGCAAEGLKFIADIQSFGLAPADITEEEDV